MRHPRRAAKVDDNQASVIKALRKAGAWVQSIGQPWDLLVFYPRTKTWHVLEVKDGSKPPSAQELSPDQLATLAALRLCGVVLVRNEEEALQAIGAKAWSWDTHDQSRSGTGYGIF